MGSHLKEKTYLNSGKQDSSEINSLKRKRMLMMSMWVCDDICVCKINAMKLHGYYDYWWVIIFPYLFVPILISDLCLIAYYFLNFTIWVSFS